MNHIESYDGYISEKFNPIKWIGGVVDKLSIMKICRKYKIEDYTINKDGSIDVDGNVNLSEKNLTKLPLKFGKVDGHFDCYNNKLTSLEGCPKEVIGDFDCSNNKLINLKGSPDEVGGDFDCPYNNLTSLEGSPKEVGGNFDCSYNRLTSLEGSPKEIGEYFKCDSNLLVTLVGCPLKIGGDLNCRDNKIYSLEGLSGVKVKRISLMGNPVNYLFLFVTGMNIELFNYYDIIRGNSIISYRLKLFLDEIGYKEMIYDDLVRRLSMDNYNII